MKEDEELEPPLRRSLELSLSGLMTNRILAKTYDAVCHYDRRRQKAIDGLEYDVDMPRVTAPILREYLPEFHCEVLGGQRASMCPPRLVYLQAMSSKPKICQQCHSARRTIRTSDSIHRQSRMAAV